MKQEGRQKDLHLYLRVADIIEQQITSEVLRIGDKLPSLRTICQEQGISQSTALQAYYHLESKALIESRPQSGYFVKYAPNRFPAVPSISNPQDAGFSGETEELVQRVYDQQLVSPYMSLSLGVPANELLPVAKLNKGLVQAMRDMEDSGVGYDQVQGNERLRRQVARWAIAMQCKLRYQDIITTSGCLNAISYCLMALTRPGDAIAVESPVSFGMLQIAQHLGLKIIELPTHPQTGIDPEALKQAFTKRKIKVCLLISNFSNPLGSLMPDEHKREVVRLVEQHHIPLIENDINGDIYFGKHRPPSCKTYDESGLVLWCGSVSKSLAPGYRVGWVEAGKFKDEVLKAKRYHAIASGAITQEVVANFMETGRYEHHLRKLRHILHSNSLLYMRAIKEHFPDGTMASRPQGGYVLWVELDRKINTIALYEKAVSRKISFAPGKMFTFQNQFDHCLRLNYGLIWNEKLAHALKTLGGLAKGLL